MKLDMEHILYILNKSYKRDKLKRRKQFQELSEGKNGKKVKERRKVIKKNQRIEN